MDYQLIPSSIGWISDQQPQVNGVNSYKKQKRKEPLVIRHLDEVEVGLEILEEPLQTERVEVKPRRKYKTKKTTIEEVIKQPPTPPPTERRTRLSNACRVATGRNYKCKDCEFSTDRINNIITHLKESCKLKRS